MLRKFCRHYPAVDYPVVLDSGFTSAYFCKVIAQDLKRDYIGNLRSDQNIILLWESNYVVRTVRRSTQSGAFNPGTKPVFQKGRLYLSRQKKHYYAYFANHRIQNFENKQRLVIAFSQKELTGTPYFVITNRLNWYPSGILRLRRQRWPVETYHQEGKAEGLDKYEVRNFDTIQSYIAFVVVTYSILQCASYDDGTFVQYSTAAPNGDGRHAAFSQKADASRRISGIG
ncbi:MAG: transposase [Lewinellaceae bacterium]|nr:transposase [Lewinellaceae bacterium]